MTWTRRRMLQTALAAGGSVVLPYGTGWPQDKSTALLRAPKQALVIGNSKYRHAPLKNPANDARSMAASLTSVGFDTVIGLEWSRSEMDNAIRAFAERLGKDKAIGLFYFAGHGAQLAWRNYAIPVDAEIETIEELRARCVDINTVVDGMRRAGNPMNMIILDACRDNPIGTRVRPDQRGLSQIDAPPGTLLAYATAPGNTAIDGDGEHGLYTEHLLREIKVPEAKIEDVFKRVRLGVRRRSNGLQIPWESTSLEDDFWFMPPQVLKKLAEGEIEKEFTAERAIWERAQKANQPEALEAYLRRYPSGRFSELAQLQLDRVLAKLGEKAIAVVPAPQNPYTKGSARTDTAYKIGDSYSYRQLDVLTRLEGKPSTIRVTHIIDDEVIFNKGGTVIDLLGNYRKWAGVIWAGSQTVPAEFSLGRRWNTRFHLNDQHGETIVDLHLRVAERETITVPAGTFNAFRVEARGWRTGSGLNVSLDWKTWYAPDVVRRPVAWEWMNSHRFGLTNTARSELIAFKQT